AFTSIVVSNPDGESGCGCFGALDGAEDNRWIVVVRNVTMSAVALFIVLADRSAGCGAMIRDPLVRLFGLTLVGLSGVLYFVGVRLLPPPRQAASRISSLS